MAHNHEMPSRKAFKQHKYGKDDFRYNHRLNSPRLRKHHLKFNDCVEQNPTRIEFVVNVIADDIVNTMRDDHFDRSFNKHKARKFRNVGRHRS